MGLHLAQEKTEIILLTGKRVPKIFKIDVGGGEITTRNTVKYLRVLLDNARRYSPHLEQACDKADRFVGAIKCLLPNVNGPTDTVRKLYCSAWESVVLYAAPIWASALTGDKNRSILKRAQRAALVRTFTAYRTVSHEALCAVTGSMPIHIKVRFRWKQYKVKICFKDNLSCDPQDLIEEMRSLNQEAEKKWMVEWSLHNPDNWTRKLIKNPLTFYRKKRCINYYTMQILTTGHGIFNYYRYRIGKESHTRCWDCGVDREDAEHVLLECPRWVGERTALENEVGVDFKLENDIIQRMAGVDRLS
jgi:hypothetical protein